MVIEDEARRERRTAARYVVLFAAAEGLLGNCCVFRLLLWMAQGHGVLDVNE